MFGMEGIETLYRIKMTNCSGVGDVRQPITRLIFGALTMIVGCLQICATTLAAGDNYTPPTAEEMAPMRPEYLAVLAKVHEPPEMTGKPMQVRKVVSTDVVNLAKVMSAIGAPDKATHEQRTATIKELLTFTTGKDREDEIEKPIIYGVIAAIACIDGVEPKTIIKYASNALGDGDDALALRARMYLKTGDLAKALDDLEKIMADGAGSSLKGGGVDPRQESASCGWSIADFDSLGDSPRALAAKGLYLSSFLAFGAQDRGTVKESDIRELYKRSAKSWHSPIPYLLMTTTLDGLGSAKYMNMAGCIRANYGGTGESAVKACAEYDEGTRQAIRVLTMALVDDPTFAPALSERASKHLELAQASYADGKPSRQLFELAINDFSAAIAAGGKNLHTLYCDRALALASVGRYQDAATGYVQGMKYAKNGVEESPFVYQQLAGVYMKIGKFKEAADVITQAIINTSGGGMASVILGGGIKAFRTLYPEYGLVPDEILADAVRRRYYPQFPQSWDADFISDANKSKSKITSTILPELYVTRGDAYMKADLSAQALADYRRVKSDAWYGEERFLPRHLYFNERGDRNYELPEPWPSPPPEM
jgi:tetratricopeptide (TPR) repeat protein